MNQVTPRLATNSADDPLELVDLWLVLACMLLLGLGLVMVGSASFTVSDHGSFAIVQRQAIYAVVAVAVAALAWWFGSAFWQKASFVMVILVVIGLVVVLFAGSDSHGAKRWLVVGGISVQVSEAAKVILLMFVAAHLARHGTGTGFLQQLALPFSLMIAIVALVLLEPDYGAAVVVAITVMGVLFVATVKPLWLMGICAVFLSLLGSAAFWQSYRIKRLTCFHDPLKEPDGCGYQLVQALIAVVRGDWFGVGLGGGFQKLYLPDAHNDFLVAILAEELGVIGIAAVLVLFSIVVWRCFAISAKAERMHDSFGSHFSFAIGLLLAVQVLIHVGVNLGVLPTKGLTLPLLSYGGSSLMVMCFAIGIVLRIDFQLRRQLLGPSR